MRFSLLPSTDTATASPVRVVGRPAGRAGLAVAHVVNSVRWGGMEARTLETAQWQAAHGGSSVIVTPRSGALFAAAERVGLPVEAVEFDGRSKAKNVARMRAIFRDHAVQVGDFHTNRSLALGVRDMATLVRSQHVLRRTGERLRLNREFPFDGFLLSSHAGREALAQGGYARPERIGVVGEWAQERFFTPEPTAAEIRVMKRRLGLEPEALVIGAVAMLRPDNAFDDLIRATARLHLRGLPVSCLIVGGPAEMGPDPSDEELRLRRLADTLGIERAIHFLGQRSDVPELLSVMDVATVVSRHTAQTRVAPEAAARGRAIVGYDVGALGETVENGRTGLLVPGGDVVAFSAAIERLLTNTVEREALAAEAGRRAWSEFRQAGRMEETLSIYRQAMARRAVRQPSAPSTLREAQALRRSA